MLALALVVTSESGLNAEDYNETFNTLVVDFLNVARRLRLACDTSPKSILQSFRQFALLVKTSTIRLTVTRSVLE